MRHSLKWAAGLLLLALLAAASFAAWLYWDWNRPYKGYSGTLDIEIPRGMNTGRILDLLAERGVVRHRLSLKMAFTFQGEPQSLQAGPYRFERPKTPLEVLEKLRKGEVILTKVTIPEGLRIEEAAQVLADAGCGSLDRFLAIVEDPSPILDLDPDAESLEGYLFPESYLVAPGISEEAMVAILVDAFREWWQGQVEEGPTLGLRETVILASLVERESSWDPERPLVSSVFLNRLRLGMPLQCDPTIIYGMIRDDAFRGRLLIEDLRYESPYNTYIHPGLPPGPICSPGRASLDAVQNPAETSYLYFVSQNDGTHAFSKTLAEHNRAVARYRRMVQQQRARGR